MRARRFKRGNRVSPLYFFGALALFAAVAVFAGLVLGAGFHWLLAYAVAINVTTFLAYLFDKRAPANGWLRVPENVLHGLALLGGTPAALLGQQVLRHKTVKQSFRLTFGLILVLQVATLAAWLYYR